MTDKLLQHRCWSLLCIVRWRCIQPSTFRIDSPNDCKLHHLCSLCSQAWHPWEGVCVPEALFHHLRHGSLRLAILQTPEHTTAQHS